MNAPCPECTVLADRLERMERLFLAIVGDWAEIVLECEALRRDNEELRPGGTP